MILLIAITLLSVASVLIPLAIALLQWKKMSKQLSPLRWLLVASLLSDILMYITALTFRNSYPVGNAYLFIQFSILVYIFSFYYENKKIILTLYFVYIILYVVDIIFFESFLRFASNVNALSNLILIILSFHYLYNLLKEPPVVHILKLPMLWLIFAVLIYSGGTLFVFLANNYLLTNLNSSQNTMWILHNAFNIIKNILFAIALWKNYKIMRSSTLL